MLRVSLLWCKGWEGLLQEAYGQGMFSNLVSRITVSGPQFVFSGEKETGALISLFQCKQCFEY